MDTADPPILASALQYAARGWSVFPCHPQDKRPVIENGLHGGATTDPAQIRAWWTEWPGAMIGVRTGEVSGIWCLDFDCDPEKQLNGIANFEKTLVLPGAVHYSTGVGRGVVQRGSST